MGWIAGPQGVKEYRRYRRSGTKLNHKIIETFVDDQAIEHSARALELGRDRQLVLDSEGDLSVLMDFALYEVLEQGKSIVERYQKEVGGRNAVERNLLKAMVGARPGLFRVEEVMPQRYGIALNSLVEIDREISLTDINLSQTMGDGLVVFLRPVELATFTMTSGIGFVFPGRMEQELIRLWGPGQGQSESARRYAEFFKLNKSKGIPTLYE